jgi:hypothetical protein
MESDARHASLVRMLRAVRRPDGGHGTSDGGQSEIEATTVATLVLRDYPGRSWLAARQQPDGSLVELDGRAAGPAVTALASLAVPGTAAHRALEFAIGLRGFPPPDAPDPNRRTAWGWTPDVRSTVEPTARVLLAVNRLTPSDVATRAEAVHLLDERRCADGGWNYGNASVNDVDLRGYAQTTAMALIALQRGVGDLVASGVRFLRDAWRREPGSLTTAQAVLAFRLHGLERDARDASRVLALEVERPTFGARPLDIAWSALATGPDSLLEPLRSRA